MIDILICDYEDSFTYNIFSELKELYPKLTIEVINYKNKTKIKSFISKNHKKILVLGPGPGHPREYANEELIIDMALKSSSTFVLGICLGHQLICSHLGASVESSKTPCHGKRIKYELKDQWWIEFFNLDSIEVQRYNSLAVKNYKNLEGLKILEYENELISCVGDQFISYQFHPESVGTLFPKTYFRPIEKFLL